MRSLPGGGDSAATRLAVPGHGTGGRACEGDEVPAWRQGRGRDSARAVPGLVLHVLLARGQPAALVARTEGQTVLYAKGDRTCRKDHRVRRAEGCAGGACTAPVGQPAARRVS